MVSVGLMPWRLLWPPARRPRRPCPWRPKGPPAVSAPMAQEPCGGCPGFGAVTTTQGAKRRRTRRRTACRTGTQWRTRRQRQGLAAAKAAQKANPPPGKVEAPAVVSRQEAPRWLPSPKSLKRCSHPGGRVALCPVWVDHQPLASLSVLSCWRKSCERPDPRDAKVCQEFKDMEPGTARKSSDRWPRACPKGWPG